jgi:hypothetical protein
MGRAREEECPVEDGRMELLLPSLVSSFICRQEIVGFFLPIFLCHSWPREGARKSKRNWCPWQFWKCAKFFPVGLGVCLVRVASFGQVRRGWGRGGGGGGGQRR